MVVLVEDVGQRKACAEDSGGDVECLFDSRTRNKPINICTLHVHTHTFGTS